MARGRNEGLMRGMNNPDVNTDWAGTSTGTYVYWDHENQRYALSITSLADTTHQRR